MPIAIIGHLNSLVGFIRFLLLGHYTEHMEEPTGFCTFSTSSPLMQLSFLCTSAFQQFCRVYICHTLTLNQFNIILCLILSVTGVITMSMLLKFCCSSCRILPTCQCSVADDINRVVYCCRDEIRERLIAILFFINGRVKARHSWQLADSYQTIDRRPLSLKHPQSDNASKLHSPHLRHAN
jgi:hypothetical protein